MKHTITIDVEIPEGYEPVIVDGKAEWRTPRPQEFFLGMEGNAKEASGELLYKRPILRKSWQPPSWMPEGAWLWNSKDWYGWVFTVKEPEFKDGKLCAKYFDTMHQVRTLAVLYGETFTAPPCDKVQIRHGKVEARPTDTAAKDG